MLAFAQAPETQDQTEQSAASGYPADQNADAPVTLFPHSESSRFWISGQANIVFQAHPTFPAAYSGPNSLRATAENATSDVLTLYTGVEFTDTTEFLFDVESTGGKGLSEALGLAGVTNLDVVRNPDLGSKPYVARIMLHQVIPFSRETVSATRGPLGLFTKLPARRLELRLGKMSLPDFFDVNSVGSDSHLQFLNWTSDADGAWDYAADTRGYTYAAMIEYDDHSWSLRFAEALMPKVANGLHLGADVARARSENIEFEYRGNFLPRRAGVVRVLTYINHADMGSYREAIQAFLAHVDPVPDVTAHRQQGRIKYGFGGNFEQPVASWLTAFGRWGWNEGANESFAYTEVNEAIEAGAGVSGKLWRRNLDRAGFAFISNGISGDHKLYLAFGGQGFLLGDGALSYGRETIVETYFTTHVWRGVFASFDLQHINNPAYNRARGPVTVPGLRMHIDF
jgi:high affinity Mn2+ porin